MIWFRLLKLCYDLLFIFKPIFFDLLSIKGSFNIKTQQLKNLDPETRVRFATNFASGDRINCNITRGIQLQSFTYLNPGHGFVV